MKEDGLGRIFLRHLVMSIPWAITFLAVFLIVTVGIKQQIKEGIQYAVTMTLCETSYAAFNRNITELVKQNIKEGLEFAGKTATVEIKYLLNDPQVKKDLKAALESEGKNIQ